MQSILLIRHAQASYGAANYDELSPRGLEQAVQLAKWLAAHQGSLQIGAISCGAMRRHEQTLAAVELAFRAAGLAFPMITCDADWNEFNHTNVVQTYATVHPEDPHIQLAASSHNSRAVRALLIASLHAWAEGELDAHVGETWSVFGARVARARLRLTGNVTNANILVISSGGVIARCAQSALNLDHSATVDLNLSLRNTGICEFHYNAPHWRLQTWNTLPHFSTPEVRHLMTYY